MYLFYEHELKKLLIHMGITPNYKGYGYIVSAMRIIFVEPDCLQHVTKELYPEIAKQYQTDWRAVERSVRSALLRSWEREISKIVWAMGKGTTLCGKISFHSLYVFSLGVRRKSNIKRHKLNFTGKRQ